MTDRTASSPVRRRERLAAATLSMSNPPDLYRLLHVHPDAPTAVIKGSYRTLMQTLRHHPDLGGDEATAQRLNEAMRTLGDPLARARYDAALAARTANDANRATGATGEAGATASDSGVASSAPSDEPAAASLSAPAPSPRCPFCDAPLPPPTRAVTSGYPAPTTCAGCGGPTRAPAARIGTGGAFGDVAGRRGSHRVGRDAKATLRRRAAMADDLDATLLEFSIEGCSLLASAAVDIDEIVLLQAPELSAIGRVRSCVGAGGVARVRLGLAFLAVELSTRPGSVFSGSA